MNFLDNAVGEIVQLGTEAEADVEQQLLLFVVSGGPESSGAHVIIFLLKEPNTATGREGFE